MTTLPMNVLIWFLIVQIGKVIVPRSVSLHLADSDTGSDTGAIFKHMKGRNGSTSFLPSKRKGGFQREIPFEGNV